MNKESALKDLALQEAKQIQSTCLTIQNDLCLLGVNESALRDLALQEAKQFQRTRWTTKNYLNRSFFSEST